MAQRASERKISTFFIFPNFLFVVQNVLKCYKQRLLDGITSSSRKRLLLMLQTQHQKKFMSAENKRVLHIAPYYCLEERQSHLS